MPPPKRWSGIAFLLLAAAAAGRAQTGALLPEVNAAIAAAAAQTSGMLARIEGRTGQPRTWQNGQVTLVGPNDWTCGFFPGVLWLLYEGTGEPRWRDAAARATAQEEAAKNNRGTHDVGFMLNCSFGQGYRLTGTAAYRDVLLTGAASLATRFNANVGAIRSWDFGTWRYPVIIDNLMNLELMLWSARAGGSVTHADDCHESR